MATMRFSFFRLTPFIFASTRFDDFQALDGILTSLMDRVLAMRLVFQSTIVTACGFEDPSVLALPILVCSKHRTDSRARFRMERKQSEIGATRIQCVRFAIPKTLGRLASSSAALELATKTSMVVSRHSKLSPRPFVTVTKGTSRCLKPFASLHNTKWKLAHLCLMFKS